MFKSFFPMPRQLALSAAAVGVASLVFWFFGGRELGSWLSLGGILGMGFPATLAEAASDADKAAHADQTGWAVTFWMYQYLLVITGAFVVFWRWFAPHPWSLWSVGGSALIVILSWFLVQIDVMINAWSREFFDILQKALGTPGSVSSGEFYGSLGKFCVLAAIFVVTAVFNAFLVSHYVFRWRTAMNDYYTSLWQRLRHIEGASQRVQEDTMRFSTTTERLGESLIDSVITLAAFLPVLSALSVHVKELPILGAIPQPLVVVALIWAIFGTVVLAVAGIRLPGLEFRNQRVEAALRKELVYGEDDSQRASPLTVRDLFANVRSSYFRLYANYLYFNVVRYSYLQLSVIVPYLALAPSVLSGGLTLGLFQQIVGAFGRVQTSFQYLVRSWPTIVELLSVYKRLRAFEATLEGATLEGIEREVDRPTLTPAQ